MSRLEYPVGDQPAGVVAGEVDVAGASGLRPEVLARSATTRPRVLEAPPGNFGSGLWWNLARGGALADARFRRASAHAIDREDLVQRLHGGNADPGTRGGPRLSHNFASLPSPLCLEPPQPVSRDSGRTRSPSRLGAG